MTNSLTESGDKSVPLTVIPRLRDVSVEPAISIAVGFAVMPSPATVAINCSGISFSSGIELVPIIRADEPSDMGVPDMVKGSEPGNSIEPAIEMLFESARKVWPFRVVICPGLHGCRPGRVMGIEFVPIIRCDGPNDIEVPCIVIEDAPGVRELYQQLRYRSRAYGKFGHSVL